MDRSGSGEIGSLCSPYGNGFSTPHSVRTFALSGSQAEYVPGLLRERADLSAAHIPSRLCCRATLGVTGLLNRHAVYVKLEQCIREAESDSSLLFVLFIDLDHFKPINDRYGHAAGDQILKITADRMQNQVRSDDCVGRLGGDEFIIILPSGPDIETAVLKVVGRIPRAVGEPIEIHSGVHVNVTASIGPSRYPIDGTSSEVLINRSDAAMYRTKRGGGNAFELFRPDNANDED